MSAWLREALHFNRGGVGGGGSGVHSSTAPAGHLPSGSPAGGGIAARLTHYPYHRASENLPPASPAGSGFGTPPRAVDVLGAYRRGTSCYGVGGGGNVGVLEGLQEFILSNLDSEGPRHQRVAALAVHARAFAYPHHDRLMTLGNVFSRNVS